MMNDIIQWSPGVTLEAVEKSAILMAFRFYRGNKTATANSLGISIRTLDNKLEKYEEDGKLEKERAAHESKRRTEFLARQRGILSDNTFTGDPKKAIADVPSAASGVRMESIANASEKPPVSMPKQEKIQAVLPQQTPQSGKSRGR